MSSTRVHESSVLNFRIGDVWSTIAPLDFEWKEQVLRIEIADNVKKNEVGALRTVVYEGGMKQTIKLLELSLLKRTVTWEVITSEPAVTYSSAVHTIRLRPITATNETFVEWITDFSSDAKNEVLQDARFKQLEGFTELADSLEDNFGEEPPDYKYLINTGIIENVPRKQRRESSVLKAQTLANVDWDAELNKYRGGNTDDAKAKPAVIPE
jgi:hypothetical protein